MRRTPARARSPWLLCSSETVRGSAHDRERPTCLLRRSQGLVVHDGSLVLELVEGRVDPDEGELALDDGQIRTPHVPQDADEVVRRVVPALPRGPGAVGTATHGA